MRQEDILKRTSIINVKNKLQLKEIYSSKDTIYVKCPFCLSNSGEMKLNTINNSYICKNCEERGYAISLFAKCNYISNKDAYLQLIKEEPDLSNNLQTSIITNTRKNSEELDIIYRTFLENLTLSSEHTMKLLKYGFDFENIEKIKFRTIPNEKKEKMQICQKMINEGLELDGVPRLL